MIFLWIYLTGVGVLGLGWIVAAALATARRRARAYTPSGRQATGPGWLDDGSREGHLAFLAWFGTIVWPVVWPVLTVGWAVSAGWNGLVVFFTGRVRRHDERKAVAARAARAAEDRELAA